MSFLINHHQKEPSDIINCSVLFVYVFFSFRLSRSPVPSPYTIYTQRRAATPSYYPEAELFGRFIIWPLGGKRSWPGYIPEHNDGILFYSVTWPPPTSINSFLKYIFISSLSLTMVAEMNAVRMYVDYSLYASLSSSNANNDVHLLTHVYNNIVYS